MYRISRLRKLHSDLENYIKGILFYIIIARAYKSVMKKNLGFVMKAMPLKCAFDTIYKHLHLRVSQLGGFVDE